MEEVTQHFIQSGFTLMQFKVRPLLALLAEALPELNVADEKDENPGVDSKTSFQKELDRLKKKDINFKKMIKNCKKNYTDKGPVSLDVHFLLKLMIETKFLELSDPNKGKCRLHHSDKCCSSCDHTQNEKKCKGCDTTENHCGIICCKHCNVCYRCHRDQLKRSKVLYMDGTKSLNDTKENLKICWVFPLMDSLSTLMKCRNLVHETPETVEPFLTGKSNSIGNFMNVKNVDYLCREIHFSAAVLCMAVIKSIPFAEDIKIKAKEMEQVIDKMFVYTDGNCQLARPSHAELKAYLEYVVEKKVAEEFEKRSKKGVYLVKNRF